MGEPYKTLERNGMDGRKKREAGKGTKTNAPILYIKTGREKEKDGGKRKKDGGRKKKKRRKKYLQARGNA